jgi:hypothetical protein
LKNFAFDKNSLNILNESSTMKMTKRPKRSARNTPGMDSARSKNSRIIKDTNKQVYDKELTKVQSGKNRIHNDDEYIRNMDKFNKFIEQQKSFSSLLAKDRVSLAKARAALSSKNTSFIGDNESSYGLYHKNLNAIYGRVRSKFNK